MTDSRPANRWPAAIVALAVVFLAALGFSMYWGITRTSGVSDPAYYSRGMGYGERLRAEQATGDWVLAVERHGGQLVLRVTGGDGTPLAVLRGSLTLLAADGSDGSSHELSPGAEPGEYRTTWPLVPPEGIRAVVELSTDGALLRRSLLLTP